MTTKNTAITNTIYNTTNKSKNQLREEGEKAMALFLKRGGVIQEAKPSRRKSSTKMSAKTTRFASGTSGFANGYPRKSIGA